MSSSPLRSEKRRHDLEGQRGLTNGDLDSPSRQLIHDMSRVLIHDALKFSRELNSREEEQEKAQTEALRLSAEEHDRIRNSAERARLRFENSMAIERAKLEEKEKRALEEQRQERIERELAEKQREIDEINQQAAEQRKLDSVERDRIEAQARLVSQKQEAQEERGRIWDQAQAAMKTRQETDRQAQEDNAASSAAAQTKPGPHSHIAPAITGQDVAHPQPPQPGLAQPTQNGAGHAADVQPTQNGVLDGAQRTQAAPPVVTDAQGRVWPASKSLYPTLKELEASHRRYLEVHQALKQMRQNVLKLSRGANAQFSGKAGDMKRAILKAVGQITNDKTTQTTALKSIRRTLDEVKQYTKPTIDIRPFLVSYQLRPETDNQVPMLLLYLMNILAKSILNVFERSDMTLINSYAITAIKVLAAEQYQWHGIPFTDLFLAKYHVRCPVLFGIYGNCNTFPGRCRTGWMTQEDPKTGDAVSQPLEQHNIRMRGLSVGYAGLSMRDFSRSRATNPFPNHHFWAAMANIVNVPPAQAQGTHFVVLREMLQSHGQAFLKVYGQAAVVALKRATVGFPAQVKLAQGEMNVPLASSVEALPAQWAREWRFTLEV
ncbi:hypothetical protein LTR50_000082 [Elasticomyces elasticus]|nr:hypothetical protein LTR50_000082 [Elasticomyces elasticus]